MVSIKDVAKEAGVGLGTVSRVINNKGAVKESTRLKVERAIESLQYRPNEVARSFKMQQTQSVALIVPTIWHPFFSKFAYHVEEALSARGYKLILCNSQNDAAKEINYISMLEKNKIDGLIAITYSHVIDQYITSHLPIVSIDRHFTEDVAYVTSDHENGGKIAARELVSRGSRHVTFLGSVSDIQNESMKRRAGFEQEVKKLNVAYSILEMEEPVEDIEQEIHNYLQENPLIDGVFAMNDKWAKIALRVLGEMGKAVPTDVQVIGFDGITASKEDPLTMSTIQQPVQEMAKEAVTTVMKLIHKEEVEGRIVLPVTFYQGNTTKHIDR